MRVFCFLLGAIYDVMARGNNSAAIFADADDREAFLANLGRVAERFEWRLWAYCLMDSHYHLLLETLCPTLSRGMREVNGVYTQALNRRHGRSGHVLQGRYKAVLLEREPYLMELSRYIVLNPVRAGLCEDVVTWPWSSYPAVMGRAVAPARLAVDETLRLFHTQRGPARRAYARFVARGVGSSDPMKDVRRQWLLGSESFVEQMAAKVSSADLSAEVPRGQRPTLSLESVARDHAERDCAIRAAYATGGYTLAEIGAYFQLHVSTISRIARGRLGAVRT